MPLRLFHCWRRSSRDCNPTRWKSTVDECIREEIQKVFAVGAGVERIYFPEKTNQVPDRPAVTLVVLSPDDSLQDDKAAAKLVETITREYGSSSRTFT